MDTMKLINVREQPISDNTIDFINEYYKMGSKYQRDIIKCDEVSEGYYKM